MGGPGVRTYGGGDGVVAGPGDDRVEAGVGVDEVHGQAGADTLDGGAGRDRLAGEQGADVLLARDNVDCAYETNGAGGPEGNRATLDEFDEDTWCDRIDRSGAGRLELHGVARTNARSARVILSCVHRTAAGAGRRARRESARARRHRVPIRLGRRERDVLTPAHRVLRATLSRAS